MHDVSLTSSSCATAALKIRVQFYFDATSGNDGTLVTADYKYSRVKYEPGSSSNPTADGLTGQARWELAGNDYAYAWSGEIEFPMFQEGGFGYMQKICNGELVLHGYEKNIQQVGCYVDSSTGKTQHLVGAQVMLYNSSNVLTGATRGKISWYRLRM